MKHCLLLLLILLPLVVNAQDKIEGIGKFRIGKASVDIIQEVASELLVQVTKGNKSENFHSIYNMPVVLEVITNIDNSDDISKDAPHCSSIRLFYISDYQVSGVKLHNLFLTFKDDRLIRLYTNRSTDIVKAIKLKYGPGNEETRRVESDCPFATSNSDIGIQYLQTWRNGDILAADFRGFIYDKACRLNSIPGFFIELTSEAASINQCERQSWLQAQAIKEKRKKDSLKDF